MPIVEQLYGANFAGVPRTETASASNQFAGRTAVTSGVATATVSTAIVGSNSLLFFGKQTAVSSNVAQSFTVSTISPGNFFTVSISPAPVGTDFVIHWWMLKA